MQCVLAASVVQNSFFPCCLKCHAIHFAHGGFGNAVPPPLLFLFSPRNSCWPCKILVLPPNLLRFWIWSFFKIKICCWTFCKILIFFQSYHLILIFDMLFFSIWSSFFYCFFWIIFLNRFFFSISPFNKIFC